MEPMPSTVKMWSPNQTAREFSRIPVNSLLNQCSRKHSLQIISQVYTLGKYFCCALKKKIPFKFENNYCRLTLPATEQQSWIHTECLAMAPTATSPGFSHAKLHAVSIIMTSLLVLGSSEHMGMLTFLKSLTVKNLFTFIWHVDDMTWTQNIFISQDAY